MLIENTEELAQNKLLLLYILKVSNIDFTNNSITEFILDKNYMNYFLIQQYLSELLKSQFIKIENKSGEDIYKIVEKGEVALDYFLKRIPIDIQEELDVIFDRIEKEKKFDQEIYTEYYEKENNQYVVNLKLIENEDTLFSIYLDVANPEQAKHICNRWKEDTDSMYQGILKVLIGESVI